VEIGGKFIVMIKSGHPLSILLGNAIKHSQLAIFLPVYPSMHSFLSSFCYIIRGTRKWWGEPL